MFIFKPLKKMPYAQAKVRRTDCDNSVTLISYKTAVVTVSDDGWCVVSGLYSRTTIKHISAFASEIGTDYYTLKRCYCESLSYNINTKEFVSLITGEIVGG